MVVTVADHGIGVSPADVPHVFERLHRGRDVDGSISGPGIGPGRVRQIVEQHGGAVQFPCREGEGTTVTGRMPAQAPASPPVEGGA